MHRPVYELHTTGNRKTRISGLAVPSVDSLGAFSDLIQVMGTWGAGVFDDDLACEVRKKYRTLLGEGYEGPAATDALTFPQCSNP